MFAAWRTLLCAPMLTICCILFAGGRVFIPPATLGKVTLPSPRSWIMCASSPANDRVAVADRAIRDEFPDAPCQIARGFHQAFLQRKPMGLGRPRLAMSRLRVLPRTGLLARDNSRLAHRPYMSAWHCHESVPHLRNPIKQAGNLCPAAVSNPWVCRCADAPSVLRFANRML